MISQVMYMLSEALSDSFCIILSIYFKRIIFLEYYPPKQMKIIKKMVLVCILGIFFLDFIMCMEISSKCTDTCVFIGAGLICLPVIYSSIIGRKRAKWLAILMPVVSFGYCFSFEVFCETLPIILHMSELGSSIYSTVVYAVLLIIIGVFYYKKPNFICNLERDIEKRRLKLGEEIIIWFFALWQLYSGVIISWFNKAINLFTISYCLTSFVCTIAVILLVLDSNYRTYYHKQNMDLQKSLITTMADLVENRDENTGGHIQRTAKYVEIIAKKLRSQNKFTKILTDKYIEDMVIAAPLHDVGKIHIPDAILNKPEKLDDTEFNTMKTHAEAGVVIINKVEDSVGEIQYLVLAKQMAEFHHERMDGKGYPHGLKGVEIPLCAKILAVADVFDALISKRCYKEAMPLEKAFAIIQEETGTHFDVDVANAFLDSKDEIEEYLREEKT